MRHVFDGINNLYECKRTTNTPKHEVDFSLISLPSHRFRDKKFQITPLELSQLQALHSQLLWLGMPCLPQLLAPLSLVMVQTPQATADTIFEVNKLAQKATVWVNTQLKTPRSSFSWSRAQLLDGPGFIAKSRAVGRDLGMSLMLWHSSRLKRVACSRNSSSGRRR